MTTVKARFTGDEGSFLKLLSGYLSGFTNYRITDNILTVTYRFFDKNYLQGIDDVSQRINQSDLQDFDVELFNIA